MKTLEKELIEDLIQSQARNEYYEYMALKEEERRQKREGVISHVTLNGKPLCPGDLYRYNDYNEENDEGEYDEYDELTNAPTFERFKR